jgi:hypothetical protein
MNYEEIPKKIRTERKIGKGLQVILKNPRINLKANLHVDPTAKT